MTLARLDTAGFSLACALHAQIAVKRFFSLMAELCALRQCYRCKAAERRPQGDEEERTRLSAATRQGGLPLSPGHALHAFSVFTERQVA